MAKDPARIATLVVLGLVVLFFLYHVRADRVMPYSDQARVMGLTVPVVPQVPGYVVDVPVQLHEVVEPGRLLIQLDTTQYVIAVGQARASLDQALQQLGVSSAALESAVAALAQARAAESIARIQYERLESIAAQNEAALAQADRDNVFAALQAAEATVVRSEAEVERARAALGPEGLDNPSVRAAVSALEKAEFDLRQTHLTAPTRGAVESLFLDVGYFANAGQPLLTFAPRSELWIQVDMKENNLGHLTPGTPVRILLDVAPGRVFHGTVQSIGFGVSQGTTNRGDLPTVSQKSSWLRQPQRFPVRVEMGGDVPLDLVRVGSQASVMAFTDRAGILAPIGRVVLRFHSLLSYLN